MKKILVVSDLHIGSTVSVMPDDVWTEDDQGRRNRISANAIQRLLYRRWEQMCAGVGTVDACFVLGDTIDGPNIKSRGFELWTPNLSLQCRTAADLLSMIKTRKYYGVQGSYYHVGENTSSDLAVMEMLRGEFGTDLVVTVEDARLHLCHEISYSASPVSKATAPSTEIAFSALHDAHSGKFNLLLRGHRHDFYDLRTAFGHIVGCPCWKVRDAFAAKKGLKMLSNLGYLLLEVNGTDIRVEPTVWIPRQDHQFKEVGV